MVKELEGAEATYLMPFNERLRRENERTEKENDQLTMLVQRKESLAQRIRKVLGEARTERQAIESELATVLAGTKSLERED